MTCKCFCEAQTNSDLKNILTQKPHTWTLLLYSCLDSHASIPLAKNYTGCTDSLTTGKTKTRARNRRLERCLLWTFWSLWFSYSSQASLSKSHVFQLNIPSDTLSLSLPCLQSRFRALRFSPAQTLSPFSSKRLTTASLSSRATTAQALSPAIVLRSTHAIPVRQNVESKGQLEKQTRETIRGLPVWNSPFLYELRRERALEQRTDNQTQTLSFSVLAQEGRIEHFPKLRKRGGGKEKRRRGEEGGKGKLCQIISSPDRKGQRYMRKNKRTRPLNLQMEGEDKIAKQNKTQRPSLMVKQRSHTQTWYFSPFTSLDSMCGLLSPGFWLARWSCWHTRRR